ncbi:MAG TPA: Hpt domain-containing protein [Opitutaceae bacterium]|nr:Hpt domain-containing protein [Opitutaceae bacterium]
MASPMVPNDDLANLIALLGEENVRSLIRTFLHEYPGMLKQLADGDRATRHRLVHSLKSNARVIGERELSAHLAALEERIGTPGARDLDAAELADIARRFEAVAVPLRAFAP